MSKGYCHSCCRYTININIVLQFSCLVNHFQDHIHDKNSVVTCNFHDVGRVWGRAWTRAESVAGFGDGAGSVAGSEAMTRFGVADWDWVRVWDRGLVW